MHLRYVFLIGLNPKVMSRIILQRLRLLMYSALLFKKCAQRYVSKTNFFKGCFYSSLTLSSPIFHKTTTVTLSLHYIWHHDSSSLAVEEWGCVGPHTTSSDPSGGLVYVELITQRTHDPPVVLCPLSDSSLFLFIPTTNYYLRLLV